MRESKGRSIIAFPSDYVALDIETTGLDPSVDEIIELAAIRVRDGVRADTFASLVKPRNTISGFITELTGITNDMVAGVPRVESILPQFCKFIGGDVTIVSEKCSPGEVEGYSEHYLWTEGRVSGKKMLERDSFVVVRVEGCHFDGDRVVLSGSVAA